MKIYEITIATPGFFPESYLVLDEDKTQATEASLKVHREKIPQQDKKDKITIFEVKPDRKIVASKLFEHKLPNLT